MRAKLLTYSQPYKKQLFTFWFTFGWFLTIFYYSSGKITTFATKLKIKNIQHMKISGVLKMTLIILLWGLCFASCSKMDNDEFQATEKKLVKIIIDETSSHSDYFFSYDNDGHLKEASCYTSLQNTPVLYKYKYDWNTSSINVTETITINDDFIAQGSIYTINILDGLARSISYNQDPTEMGSIKYNASNRVSEYSDRNSNGIIIWDNDKLLSVTCNFDSEDYYYISSFTYGDQYSIKGYSPLIPEATITDMLFIAHPELGGMKTNQIPVSETNTWTDTPDDIVITHYKYEFDNEGYISKITAERNINVKDTNVVVYTLTWE